MTAPEIALENCIRNACQQAMDNFKIHALGTSTDKGEREWYDTYRNPHTGTIWYRYHFISARGTFDCIGATLESCRAKCALNFKKQ